MTRKDFLSSVGLSATAFSLLCCEACKKSSDSADTTGPSSVDFTLDLSASANAALLSNGGSLISNGVIVARTIAGAYIAVQKSCTHQSYTLAYQGSNSRFYCANHGATFSENGTVLTGPASRSLSTYHTTLTGTSLRVYS